MLMPGWRE